MHLRLRFLLNLQPVEKHTGGAIPDRKSASHIQGINLFPVDMGPRGFHDRITATGKASTKTKIKKKKERLAVKYNKPAVRFRRSGMSLSVSAALAIGAVIPGFSLAQEAEEGVETIQVTGSRILQRGNYTGANPVQTLNEEDLRRLGITNMAEAMTQQISQNISNFQPGMTGDLMSLSSSFFVGATLANLRGLNDTSNFGSRTLTLVNGRRMVSSSNMSDVVDMNVIPSNLLQRMDVVTGGASAAYGSGAMAGVVNMVLNNRLEGVNLDLDYGVTDKGDGDNYHLALSGGRSLFDGRGHVLGGLEYQEQRPIRSCADARDWCREGRGLMTNNSNFAFTPNPENPINPYPQYGDKPANFRASNQRYNQFSPNGTIPVVQNADASFGYRFTDDGRGVETYPLGVRGGATGPGSTVIDGDGPPRGTNSSLTSGYERTSVYGHFEYDFSEMLQGYVDINYAYTFADNIQWPTQGWVCVRFDERSVAGRTGANLPAGTVVTYGQSDILNDPSFGAFGTGWIWQPGNGVYDQATLSWTLLNNYEAPDITPVPAQRGPNENAYLGNLSPEAIEQLQQATLARGGEGTMQSTSGNNAQQAFGCAGHAGVYKLWGPQMVQSTERDTHTGSVTFGLKGNFGETWNWDVYFNSGRTETSSLQLGAQTNWRYAFATDAILDPRPESPTFGQPVCRVLVEGLPPTKLNGDPFPPDVLRLAEGCRPLNPFGTYTADQEALDYAFRPLLSDGTTTLNVLAFNSSGQIWEGFGAGPISMAAGLEVRQDKVDNAASDGAAYERIDFPFPWSDAYGGKTTVYEEYLEVNVPLLADLPLINQFSVNGAIRHAKYRNKGGAGTTGASGTQEITNWKFSTTWKPFEPLTLRVTLSRDLRAATYRELYINQPALADSSNTNNLWITRSNESSDEQRDMIANRTVGNPNLRPETSDTYTAGFVFSPGKLFGGRFEGMNLSVDYYQIDIKDGLTSEFGSAVESCWEQSGNVPAQYDSGTGALIDPGVNGLFDPNNRWCQQLDFGPSNPLYPDNPFSNLTEVRQTFTNRDPFQTRGIDISWDYMFGLDALHQSLPGALAMRLTATHALEASTTQQDVFFGTEDYTDVVGQVGNGIGFTFGLPVQPTPKWAGNFSFSWLNGPASVTLSARYVGSGKIDVDSAWGPGEEYYQNAAGQYLEASIDNNNVPSYLNWALNGSYNLDVPGTKQFQLWGQINNLFDKEPLFSGGYVGGTNPMFYDTLGRSFKIGVRTRF